MMAVTGVEIELVSRTRRPVNLYLLVKEDALVHGSDVHDGALVFCELDEGIKFVASLAYYLSCSP